MKRLVTVFAPIVLLGSVTVARAETSLDEVVAVVETRSITRSELEVEAHLQRAFVEGPAALARPLDDATLANALGRMLEDWVVYTEAERLQVFRVSDAEVEAAVAALAARLAGPSFQKFLAEYELDERSLAELAERQMRVARYLDGRFRLAARPREQDVRAYYEAHAGDFAGQPYENAAEMIRARLQRERLAELSRAFVADVRQRASVRVLRGFGPTSDEARRSGGTSAAEAGRGSVRGGRAP